MMSSDEIYNKKKGKSNFFMNNCRKMNSDEERSLNKTQPKIEENLNIVENKEK